VKPLDSSTLANSPETSEVNDMANRLTLYARHVGVQCLSDERLRAKFTQEISRAGQAIVTATQDGRLSPEEAQKALTKEYSLLFEQALEYSKLVAGVAAGVLQIGTGVAVCKLSLGLGCTLGGLPLILHGANNIYENGRNIATGRNDTIGPVRKGYQRIAEIAGGRASQGNIGYGAVDIGLSAFGMSHMILKTGTWRLFRYIEADKIRAYREMGKGSIMFEVGIYMMTGEQILVEWEKQ